MFFHGGEDLWTGTEHPFPDGGERSIRTDDISAAYDSAIGQSYAAYVTQKPYVCDGTMYGLGTALLQKTSGELRPVYDVSLHPYVGDSIARPSETYRIHRVQDLLFFQRYQGCAPPAYPSAAYPVIFREFLIGQTLYYGDPQTGTGKKPGSGGTSRARSDDDHIVLHLFCSLSIHLFYFYVISY